MLSIGKLTPGRADYYVEQLPSGMDEYYTRGDEEGTPLWLGYGCGHLGLAGPVTPEAFRHVLEARHPATGEELGIPRTTGRRVAGFDLCFSAPKSVSVLWALAPADVASRVTAAHDLAVRGAIQALEAEAIRARRGAGGHTLVETAGVVAAAFPHRSSRAGDPQIHTHAVVANLTADFSGRWSAVYGQLVYRWSKTIGYLYQAELRRVLSSELGVRWGPVRNGMADIDGIPKEAIERFSIRRAQIVSEMERQGATSAVAAQVATLSTRAAKSAVPDLMTLRDEWSLRASDIGLDSGRLESVLGRHTEPLPDLEVLAAELLGPAGLTANCSAFDRRDVLQAIAGAHPSGNDVRSIRRAASDLLNRPEVTPLSAAGPAGQLYSTADLLSVEQRLIETADRRLPLASRHQIPSAQIDRTLGTRPHLSEEQASMVRAITTSEAAVQVVIGRAGAGKTFALDAAREIWATAGRTVIGTALAARAAAELQAGAGIPSTTLDRLLADIERPGPMSALTTGTVVVVDEAGMVGTRKLARLLDHAGRHGASVVLVGDPRQLPEIQAGGAFAALAHRVPTVELTDNRRQQEFWERDALSELRAGSVPIAIAAYATRGRITLVADALQAREKMVDDWWQARVNGARTAMYALRRSDVEDLNDRARSRMRTGGLLRGGNVNIAGRPFCMGDEVMCLRNDRRLGIRNGTTGTITGIDKANISITLNDGTVLSQRYLEDGHLTHAYATTIHKAQGATVDRAFLLGSDAMFREAGYVGLSRARVRSDLYLVAPALDRCDNDQIDAITRLAKDLARSRAERLALEQLTGTTPTRAFGSPDHEAALANPAPWMVDALGHPPVRGPDRQRWAERAVRIAAYRDIYQIEGLNPLGPRPDDPAQCRAWDLAQLTIQEHQRSLEIDQGLHL